KVYDRTTAAVITGHTLAGVLPEDVGSVSLTGGTATFADKNAGTGKTVTATGFRLTGPAAGKYILAGTTATATANITKAALSVTPEDAQATYTGATYAATASASGTAAAVALAARVEINSGDPTPGDLSTALVAFIDRSTGQVLADNVPVTVNPSDPRQGTATA